MQRGYRDSFAGPFDSQAHRVTAFRYESCSLRSVCNKTSLSSGADPAPANCRAHPSTRLDVHPNIVDFQISQPTVAKAGFDIFSGTKILVVIRKRVMGIKYGPLCQQ